VCDASDYCDERKGDFHACRLIAAAQLSSLQLARTTWSVQCGGRTRIDCNARRYGPTTMTDNPAALVFPPSARAAQERLGSRALQGRRERPGGFSQTVDERLRSFLTRIDSFFIATATADGQPYIQHRGGPRGFLKVLGPSTLGFADFSGNRQYITVGRLAENPAVCLFLIDYERRARVKLWGRASVAEGDLALLGRLADPAYAARIERAILIEIDVWDVDCRQHIPQKLAAEDVAAEIERLQSRIRQLETENAVLRQQSRTIYDMRHSDEM
jgi:predicted pyridoxine 5'-phosphate oxidase superfamily flavin-nucleotide-binding protein